MMTTSVCSNTQSLLVCRTLETIKNSLPLHELWCKIAISSDEL